MGSGHGKLPTDETPAVYKGADTESHDGAPCKKREDKRSPKDSGYGSRLNTDDLQSPSHSNSDKSSPRSLPSSAKGEASSPHSPASQPDDGSFKILTLVNSPVLVNKSYRQFYYLDDSSSFVAREVQSPDSVKAKPNQTSTPTRGKYPKQPLLPRREQSKATQNQLTVKSIKAIKSASCSSLDRLSLTSSLEEYAFDLVKGTGGEEPMDENEAFGRGRLLSVTRFETLTGNLETPQCATIVKVTGPSPSSSASGQKEKKQKKHLLSRFYIGRRKNKSELQLGAASQDVIMTQAGRARLRKKGRGHGRQRMVVSDDLTHKVKFVVGEAERPEKQVEELGRNRQLQTTTTKAPTPIRDITDKRTQEKSQIKIFEKQPERSRKKELCRSAEHAPPTAGTYLVQENHIGPFSAELSQSLDGGLSDLKHLEIQLKKLAQPSQSTTNLDLSQRVLETETSVGLRVSHSMDDIGDPMGTSLSQTKEISSDDPPREGFLWRVLGRASQRWPALIHIVPILTNQPGMRGFGVRKGQQVRALYRVSGQVIVETETNHLACIPYECCRISRKYYGPHSQLVQLSYMQLYVPVPDLPASVDNHPSTSNARSTPTASPARHLLIHTPIEMVAIQDNYDRLPLGEINVDAGDKLRVLYCDEKRVFAVKENGEAGIIARNYCRLTRRSEKMYQKWVELTRSPFQADYPVKFGEKPPQFLFDGTLSELKEVRSKPTTPEAHRKLRVKSTEGDTKHANTRVQSSAVKGSSKEGLQKRHKPLPPTPPGKRKEKTPVSPLTQNGLKSPLSPVRQPLGRRPRTLSPITAHSPIRSLPPSPSPKSPLEVSATAPPQRSNSTPSHAEGAKSSVHPSAAHRRETNQCSFSYAGKLMTVVRNYSPKVGNAESTIRKGLRVRVVRSSPDGKTLRVATKSGTQFDIPVSHLCMSRKNSEPSPFRNEISHEIALVSNSIPSECLHSPLPTPRLKRNPLISPPAQNLPLECGKIMTVIRNFVPSPDDPMITIRRGLRVKVLGGQDDQVKVVTKTGTTFSIPRSHLRLSHKTSDASAFAAVDTGTKSPPTSPQTRRAAVKSPEGATVNGRVKEEQSETPHDRPHSRKHVHASPSVNGSHPELPPSSCNGTPSNRVTGRPPAAGAEGELSSADSARRGCRVNSTGSQVFELC